MKDWWKEISKLCLNVMALTVAVFIFGAIRAERWEWREFLFGWLLLVLLAWGSRLAWRKGVS
ncbi:MAG: hypothetical protein HY709_09045 [Candidatus Latescibacteria bacterium]|nr:hypothetical protein [Candidatus Latescibacterota bacterium]